MKINKRNILIGICLILICFDCIQNSEPEPMFGENDWPNWRGLKWDGFSLEKDWSPEKLSKEAILWEAEVGYGFSSMAVVNNLVYTAGKSRNLEFIYCFDASNGNVVWKYQLPFNVYSISQATPTIEGDRLYYFNSDGNIVCINRKKPAVIWRKNLVKTLDIEVPMWGFAGSVKIHKNLVIINAGSGGIALDKKTGRIVWVNKTGKCGYATPVLFQKEGETYVTLAMIDRVVMASVNSGKIRWSFEWSSRLEDIPADPLIIGDTVLISSAYQKGAALIDFTGFQSKSIWVKNRLVSNIASYVYENGLVYGTSNPLYNIGDLGAEFFCLNVSDGKKLWSIKEICTGTVIAAGDYLIHLDQKGEVKIGLRTPSGFEVVNKCRILWGYCITPPAFSNGRLFCRNRQGKLVCVDLRNN